MNKLMNANKCLVFCFLLLQLFIKAEANEVKLYEMPGTQVLPIKDTQSDRQYELYIKLPEGYSKDDDKKYPVIYFTDAVWHIEILSAATALIMKDVILVGVSWEKNLKGELAALGAHGSRFRDYSIQASSNPESQRKYQLGQANNHLNFIRNDVIKYIENNYRTDPVERTYFGYSMGGKFGAYILSTHPATFKNYILGSPSLSEGRDVPVLSKLVSNEAPNTNNLSANILISYGDLETESSPYIDDIIAMLKNRNDERFSIKHMVIEGNHETAFPMTAVRSVTWLANLTKNETQLPLMKGPYMGQIPPGLNAEPFAPGIISNDGWELEGVFAPGMKEFYYTVNRGTGDKYLPTVVGFRQENDVWKKFTEFTRSGEITFSPDGKRMYMAKRYKERVADGWSARISLGPMFDRDEFGIMRLSASSNGTYVFDDFKSDGVIRISTLKDGVRQSPTPIHSVVNTGEMTAHPFIAPDESYLIWDSEREGGYGDSDLYISFKQKDGAWGPAINMGDKVNSDKWDAYASVTPDGQYILFNRGIDEDNKNVDIYWVDAQIIETLKPK